MISLPASMRQVLWLLGVSALPIASFGQTAPKIAPVPADPLELVTGPVQSANTPAAREAALQLLGRARNNFALRNGDAAFDLKVDFAADSGGQTNYDGAWEMEDRFVPGQGLRWTAKAAAGYQTTRITAPDGAYGEGTANAVPLRLHEARGLLIDPVPSTAYASRGSVRTAAATFRGAAVTCVLLSHQRNPLNPPTGRGWDESEECIDPQSGLLQVHSEAPGRYAVYDYTNAPQLGSRVLPRKVTVTEAGKVVSTISVESLAPIAATDASEFVPTDSMRKAGPPTTIAAATRISRIHGQGPFTSAMTVRPVCVFGVVTPTGQLVEAHSLQPSDPNSAAAVEDAKSIDFSPTIPAGATAQHFVFVIEKFVAGQQSN
jgi:hypothetical protein